MARSRIAYALRYSASHLPASTRRERGRAPARAAADRAPARLAGRPPRARAPRRGASATPPASRPRARRYYRERRKAEVHELATEVERKLAELRALTEENQLLRVRNYR